MTTKSKIIKRETGLFQYGAQRTCRQIASVHGYRNAPLVALAEKYPMTSALSAKYETVSLKNSAHGTSGYRTHTLMDRRFHFDGAQERRINERDILAARDHIFQVQFNRFPRHRARLLHRRSVGHAAWQRGHRHRKAAFQIRFEHQLESLFPHDASIPYWPGNHSRLSLC